MCILMSSYLTVLTSRAGSNRAIGRLASMFRAILSRQVNFADATYHSATEALSNVCDAKGPSEKTSCNMIEFLERFLIAEAHNVSYKLSCAVVL